MDALHAGRLPREPCGVALSYAAGRQRSHGRLELAVARIGPDTRALRIAESGPLRLRLPRTGGPGLEAVLMNTGGGIACGDVHDVAVDAGDGARIALATPSAEKVYRSDGPLATAAIRLSLGHGADLAWLPQETILFDEARFARSITVELGATARYLGLEAVVFGRTARGEDVRHGSFTERWRIRRDGSLIFADSLRLSGAIASSLDRAAIGGGARALATLVYVAPDAERRLDEARSLLQGSPPVLAGASAWNGLLAVRWIGRNGAELRAAIMPFVEAFRACALPRVWRT